MRMVWLEFGCLAVLLVQVHALSPATTPRLTEEVINHQANGFANGLDREPVHLAGYFKLNRTHDAHMFFFFFEARDLDPKAPLVLWMTGGPGCSSELAVFYENGPYTIKSDLTLEAAPYGWDVEHNMIFVDQPINTGFSWSEDPRDRIHDEVGVANDMLDFLSEFIEAHPEFDGRDFFVTGESYAGHYVPAVAYRMFQAKQRQETRVDINLKGFAIGNGLTNPEIQYGAYADFALLNDLITAEQRDRVLQSYPACQEAIQMCNGHDWKAECLLAVQYCTATQVQGVLNYIGSNMNIYDIRKPCVGQLCYDFSNLDKYLAQPNVRQALGVGNRTWTECNMEVYHDMQGDWMKNYETVVQPMLEGGIRVMIYAGDQDFICNYVGNKRWVLSVDWEGKHNFNHTEAEEWTVDGEPAGSVTAFGPLWFVRVFQAGHMVPMDQPKNAFNMITSFTQGSSLTPSSIVA